MEKSRKIEILSPIAGQEDLNLKLAPRPEGWKGDLKGKTIGLLDNLKPNASVILSRAGEKLAQRFPSWKVLLRSKPEQAAPVPEAIVREFSEKCSVVLNGLAD